MKLKHYIAYEMENGNHDWIIAIRRKYSEEILFLGRIASVESELHNEEVFSIAGLRSNQPIFILEEKEITQKEEVEAPKEMVNNTTIKVPKKYQPMLEVVDQDGDGYWAYAREGYIFKGMGCGTAHEYTQKELLDMIRTIQEEA
jgi:hypothetical protein